VYTGFFMGRQLAPNVANQRLGHGCAPSVSHRAVLIMMVGAHHALPHAQEPRPR
jgi:hypothetical protein